MIFCDSDVCINVKRFSVHIAHRADVPCPPVRSFLSFYRCSVIPSDLDMAPCGLGVTSRTWLRWTEARARAQLSIKAAFYGGAGQCHSLGVLYLSLKEGGLAPPIPFSEGLTHFSNLLHYMPPQAGPTLKNDRGLSLTPSPPGCSGAASLQPRRSGGSGFWVQLVIVSEQSVRYINIANIEHPSPPAYISCRLPVVNTPASRTV